MAKPGEGQVPPVEPGAGGPATPVLDFRGAPEGAGVPEEVDLPFVEGIFPPVVGTTPVVPTPGEPPIDVVPPVDLPDMDGA